MSATEPSSPRPALRRDQVREVLSDQLVLAPLTRGGNLPFRRLCVEMGARVTFSEMADARSLARGNRQERVLLRRSPDEPCFGVQLAARAPDDAVAAARLAVEQGASFIDVNAGCPIHSACRRGLGAALLQKPRRLEKLLQALRPALEVPLFLKIRSGYREGRENAREIARLAEDCGVDALSLHARTREQRYRRPADWDLIDRVAAERSIPVIGNGDVLHASDARKRLEQTHVTAVMAARGALIQPWIWQDFASGTDRARSAEERLAVYRRWVELAMEAWGDDEHAFARIRQFLEFHLDFWRRHVPLDADVQGENTMQGRSSFEPRNDLEAVLIAAGPEGLDRACRLVLEPFAPPAVALRPTDRGPDASAGGWA